MSRPSGSAMDGAGADGVEDREQAVLRSPCSEVLAGLVGIGPFRERLREALDEEGPVLRGVLLQKPDPVEPIEQGPAPRVVLGAVGQHLELHRRRGDGLDAAPGGRRRGGILSTADQPKRHMGRSMRSTGQPGAGQGAARRLLPEDLVDGNAFDDGFQDVGDRDDAERDQGERGLDEEGGLFGRGDESAARM